MADAPVSREIPAEQVVDEHHVRRLLSAARRADPLRGDAVAEELQRVTESANIGEALKKLVEITFKDLGHMGSRLSELILRSDLDGSLSFTEVASRMGLSLRQFFRYRARAVQMLAGELHVLIRHPPEPTDTLGFLFDTLVNWNPGGALDLLSVASSVPFELEAIRTIRAFVETARAIPAAAFEKAQKQSPAIAFAVRSQQRAAFGEIEGAEEDLRKGEAALHSVADATIRRAVQRELLQARFVLARNAGTAGPFYRMLHLSTSLNIELDLHESINLVEAACYAGEVSNLDYELKRLMQGAQRQHDALSAARLCLFSAIAIAAHGDLRRARQLAYAAGIASQHHVWISHDSWILDKRLALISGISKPDAVPAGELPEGSWHFTMANSVVARQLLAQRRLMECRSLAVQSLATARERGYLALAAYNDCTLAAIDGVEGRLEDERERYLRAWHWYLRARDFIVGLDLFTPPNANWREIGVFSFKDLGIFEGALESSQTREEVAVLIPLTERYAWISK